MRPILRPAVDTTQGAAFLERALRQAHDSPPDSAKMAVVPLHDNQEVLGSFSEWQTLLECRPGASRG